MPPVRLLALVVTVCVVGLTAGCVAGTEAVPTPDSAETATPAASASATPSPSSGDRDDDEVDQDGTATDNLPVFTRITETVWDSEGRASGRAYIDALVEAGFDRTTMQVTADESTVGNEAESLQFSVRWGDECLIGQVGPATGEPVTGVFEGLPDERCLIGQTRPIDW